VSQGLCRYASEEEGSLIKPLADFVDVSRCIAAKSVTPDMVHDAKKSQ
jgi:hypothetical protein